MSKYRNRPTDLTWEDEHSSDYLLRTEAFDGLIDTSWIAWKSGNAVINPKEDKLVSYRQGSESRVTVANYARGYWMVAKGNGKLEGVYAYRELPESASQAHYDVSKYSGQDWSKKLGSGYIREQLRQLVKEEINQLEENYYIDIHEWEEEEYLRDWLERCAEEDGEV